MYGPSNGEKPILDFIINILQANNIPFVQDDKGNIVCLNYPNTPMLSAHTDCVGTAESGHYVRFVDIYPYGDDEIMKGLKEYAEITSDKVKSAVKTAGETAVNEIKSNAPHDTGKYAKSWSVKTAKETSDSLVLTAYSPL